MAKVDRQDAAAPPPAKGSSALAWTECGRQSRDKSARALLERLQVKVK
jgi:hypothetical protein